MLCLQEKSFSQIQFHSNYFCCSCGIVLCSRDAKFAVDCDTCRLSYCLVCLASGSKDPCVRCGHRPSKRMEQLVHLRLKSIYKAFKSSSSGAIAGGNSNNTSSSKGRKGKTNDSKKDGGRSQRNKPTTLEDMVADHNDDDNDLGVAAVMMGASAAVLPDRFCYDLQQNYIAEQQRADAAAEALLAELEEEETAKEQKKSKKKKKKERKNANKQSKPATNETKNKASDTISSKNDASKDAMSESESADEATKDDDDDAGDSKQKAEESKMDPIEKELVDCVNNVDLEGIESILFRLKGVPGRAALRKNAKKALKRLKLELNPPSPAAPETDRKSIKKTAIPPSIAELSKQMASTKPVTRNEKTSNDSTKGSRKNNGTTRCEAQVEIVSRLVGWMIGKNGQRIRDLMEESGAKIWIDQEKIKGQETRNVYISGNRKSVDHAVILVNDVITNAPPPPGSASNVNAATSAMANMTVSHKPVENQAKAPSTASPVQSATPGTVEVKSVWTKTAGSSGGAEKELGSIPKPPAFITSNTEAAKSASEMQNIETPALLTGVPNNLAPPAVKTLNQSAEVTTEIVTCDVRFVPLLIGKRGWTIKNIQDDSGARVDIDQTVTPRQVRISGSKANVDKAVTMVRDVLSYPHAQLQASSESSGEGQLLGTDMHLFELKEPASSPTKQKLVAASAILEDNAARISSGVGNGDRVNSPPPPVVGDSKTAISAASSLSSTPEPSMASMSKGYIPSHLQNAPLLPPPAEHHIVGNSASQPVARQLLQPEAGFGDGLNSGGLWPSMAVGPGATTGVVPQAPHAVNSGQFMSHGAPLHIQQQQGRSLQLNNAPPHLQQHPNHNQNINQQSLFPTGNLSGGLGVSPTYNLYNNDGMPAAPASVATPLRDLMSGVSSGPAISSPPRGPGFIESGSRLWNSGKQAPASGLQPHLSPGFGPTSIGLSSGHNLQSNRSGLDSSMGYPNPQTIPSQQPLPSSNPLSLAANTTSNFAPPGLTKNDDSRMIDSLFGGGGTAPSSNANATNTLLSGLNGLSLPNEGDARNQSGLWGATNLTESWREGGSDNPNMGNIFSNDSNNQNQGHPQQSRFNWG